MESISTNKKYKEEKKQKKLSDKVNDKITKGRVKQANTVAKSKIKSVKVSGGIKIPKCKSTGEKQVFENIRNTRKHICTNCDKYITEPASRCFAHLLAKGMYPKYRLYENNIALVCTIDCHHEIDKRILGHKIRIQQLLELGTSFIGIANAIGLNTTQRK